jgi:hypothetical protein
MQYILIVEIKVENKSALSNNATAPIFLANAIASPLFHADIARIHPQHWGINPLRHGGNCTAWM